MIYHHDRKIIMNVRAKMKGDIQDRIVRLTKSDVDEFMRCQLLVALYEPRPVVKDAIKAAYNDKGWDWTKSDGCTGVDEAHSPKGYRFPCCVAHDHGCELVRRGKITRAYADKLFLWAMIDFGMPLWAALPWRSAVGRWLGVRVAWLGWGKWHWLLWGKKRWNGKD